MTQTTNEYAADGHFKNISVCFKDCTCLFKQHLHMLNGVISGISVLSDVMILNTALNYLTTVALQYEL